MEKEFIPYKQALALKELGFDKLCMYAYCEKGGWNKYKCIKEPIAIILRCNGNPFGAYDNGRNWNKQYDVNKNKIQCSAPTFSQAFKWLREKYNIDSMIQPTYTTKYQFRMFHVEIKAKVQIYGEYMGKEFKSYEEAELECLKKLIEMVKKNNYEKNNIDTNISNTVY